MPELLGNSSELHKLQSKDLQNRIETRLEKNVDEARRYSSLLYYVCNYLGKHQELSTSVRMSVEETETAKRYNQIPPDVVFALVYAASNVQYSHL